MNIRTSEVYTDLALAAAEAQSGDRLKLGEGNYTLYKVASEGHTKGKDLTFEGSGTDKTSWNVGAEVPDPTYFGTEYNGDYSFDGAGTVTFKNMTLRSGSANYLGFIRADNTVVDGCVVDGKTFYWGYQSATFTDTTFNAPSGDYAIWTYSSPIMTFNGCTFNASGKVINVYTDAGAGKNNITVNVNNCTFNSSSFLGFYKQALNINDSNMGDYKYVINFTGNNMVTAERVCNRDASHIEKETVKASYKVAVPATTEKEGEGTNTAVFENQAFETQVKTEPIAKLSATPSDSGNPSDPADSDNPAKSPDTAQSQLDKTGDATLVVLPAVAAIAVGSVLCIGFAARRRKSC